MLWVLILLLILLLYNVRFVFENEVVVYPFFHPFTINDGVRLFLFFVGVQVVGNELYPVYAHTLAVIVSDGRLVIQSPAYLPWGVSLVLKTAPPFISVQFSMEKEIS